MITTSNTETLINHEKKLSTHSGSDAAAAEFAERARSNQAKLTSELKSHYDFIVCGEHRVDLPKKKKVVSTRIFGETGCNHILEHFFWSNHPQKALTLPGSKTTQGRTGTRSKATLSFAERPAKF
jgi:hypothetical protein